MALLEIFRSKFHFGFFPENCVGFVVLEILINLIKKNWMMNLAHGIDVGCELTFG